MGLRPYEGRLGASPSWFRDGRTCADHFTETPREEIHIPNMQEEDRTKEPLADVQNLDPAWREHAHILSAQPFGVASATSYATEFPDKTQTTTFIDEA
jgi:hypothetical protein